MVPSVPPHEPVYPQVVESFDSTATDTVGGSTRTTVGDPRSVRLTRHLLPSESEVLVYLDLNGEYLYQYIVKMNYRTLEP